MSWPRGFYGVVNEPANAASAVALAEQLALGGASVVQLRMKSAPTRVFLDAAIALRERLHALGVPFVVNDRLEIALAVGADGLHLGQDDLPIVMARRAIAAAGATLVVGVSTHSPAQAEAAARAGADYLGFGPVYATSTKENPDPVQGVGALAEAVRRAAPVPIVAIGGVTPERAGECAVAGAAAACVISAVNDARDVVSAARAVANAWRV